MKILKNHFNYNTTYIVGEYITNGCETFHYKDSQDIFDELEVHQETQDEMLSYVNPNEDWEELANHEYWFVRYLVGLQGKCLNVLVKDEHCDVRLAVAEQGYRLDILKNDENSVVRAEAERQLKLNKRKRNPPL